MANATIGPITLNLPSKYASASSPPQPAPSVDWLARTWTVTHSTLSMWRTARNVRITYTPLPPSSSPRTRIDDLVEYEPSDRQDVLKTVRGVDTASGDDGDGGGWDWRGRGWLFFVSSHWEVLGWGETTRAEDGGVVERWAVTWFAPTVFTHEGVDVYSDRREGVSDEVYGAIRRALGELKGRLGEVVGEMRPVEIRLPWTEK